MRSLSPTLIVAVVALAFASPAPSLERAPRALDDTERDQWSVSRSLATIAYYNNCTGWVWVWSGWSPGEQIGVCYDIYEARVLNTSWALTFSPAPSGYGFTGTVSVQEGCTCTGAPIAQQPFLPTSGWNASAWGIDPPRPFLVLYTWAAPPGSDNDTGFATDHPAAGPTGPTSCGHCFPATRTTRSFLFGVGGSACPGNTLSDGVCDVEFMHEVLIDDGGFNGGGPPVGIGAASWGRIKSLYQ